MIHAESHDREFQIDNARRYRAGRHFGKARSRHIRPLSDGRAAILLIAVKPGVPSWPLPESTTPTTCSLRSSAES